MAIIKIVTSTRNVIQAGVTLSTLITKLILHIIIIIINISRDVYIKRIKTAPIHHTGTDLPN